MLSPWKKAMANLDSILKSRDIILATKVCVVKAMVFPVVMYGCESWTIKKAECWRIDAFELWCWRRLLISYVKWIASPGSMRDTGCSGLVHWDDPEGWYWAGGGRGLRMGNTCTPVADSCWCMAKLVQYCKVISLQLN